MNWLAHTFLSADSTDFRLGNLLADVVRGEARTHTSLEFRRGADCHKIIDAFTDAHPLVLRSRMRAGADYRRFSGVLIDVFYDHLLATHWHRYSAQPLDEFTTEFYASVKTSQVALPLMARETLERIIRYDSLGSYRRIEGVERALRRISAYLAQRWRKPFQLERSIPVLLANESGLTADFEEFFPQLQVRVVQWLRSGGS